MQSIHEFNEEERCNKCGCEKPHCTEDCPETPITDEDKEKIKAKLLDYRGDKWRTYMKINW